MENKRSQKINCVQCRNEITIGVWDKVELPYDVELKQKVLENTLFKVDCFVCGASFTISYQCQYNDLENKYLLWVAPVDDEKHRKPIEEYNKSLYTDHALRLAQGGYRYRIVRDNNELREKVVIFDNGLDDRIVETMKLVYVPLIKKKVGENVRIRGIYFDKKSTSDYQFVVAFEDREAMSANINMDLYKDMNEKLKGVIQKFTPEGLCRIDADWALNVMMQKVGE